MDEKILIKSEQYGLKKFIKTTIIVGVILSVVFFIYHIISTISWASANYDRELNRIYLRGGEIGSKFVYILRMIFSLEDILICLIPVVACALFCVIIYFWLRSYELTVTDKRIYGKVAWGKRVDLPVDAISATATTSLLKGVSVSTASGRISFRIIKNSSAIYEVMNNLLIERQKKEEPVNEIAQSADTTDQLKKFKDLLDSGVISQEEFDAKKKQLLGL